MRRPRVIDLGPDNDYVSTSDEEGLTENVKKLTKQADWLAQHVRTIYCTCRRERGGPQAATYGEKYMSQWDGGETPQGRRATAVWPKIAEKLVQCGADPVDFIRAQFENANWARPPAPNSLLSEAAVDRWRTYKEGAGEKLQRLIESDVNQVSLHVLPLTVTLKWPYKKALEHVLCNRSLPVTPLIRYCFAVREELLDAAAQYREPALLQYVLQLDDYASLMADMIPPELHAQAVDLRRALVGN